MPVKLYKMDLSPPARAVMMACDIFNVPVEMIDVNLLEKEHLKPEFIKKNPQHTIPFIEDGDLIITDSHAILQYLADKYGKSDALYPKDVKKRALVNQKLLFNACLLFPRLRNVTFPAIIKGERKVPKEKLDDILEVYGFFEEYLTRSKFLAADSVTIADVAALPTITSLDCLMHLNAQEFPKTAAWVKEMKRQPFCKKYNEPGHKMLEELINKAIDL